MSFAEFRASLASGTEPAGLSPALLGLWYDGRGDWEHAHQAAQGDASRAGSWVHAYLHRKEGDEANAGYWYRRAARTPPPPGVSLEREWQDLTEALLATSDPAI